MKVRFFLIPVLVPAMAMFAAAPAAAQSTDIRSLADTVSRLERQLQTLERNVYRGGGAPAPATAGSAPAGDASPAGVAALSVRVGDIEEQLRQATGEVERLGHEVRQISSRLEKALTDIDFRLRSLEQGGTPGALRSDAVPAPAWTDAGQAVAAAPAGTSPEPGVIGTLTESQLRDAAVTPSAAPQSGAIETVPPASQTAARGGETVTLPAGAPAEQYEYAFSYLMRRDFPGAEEAFRQFVEAHPEDALAGNAQYWLGETYYVRNDFASAARAFAEGFQRYPESTKAADNLLKLGLSLAALERKDDACITFAKLSTAYPGAAANVLQRAKRERDKLGCS